VAKPGDRTCGETRMNALLTKGGESWQRLRVKSHPGGRRFESG
jgi:hypothetical protein